VVTTRVEHPAVKNLCDNLDIFTGRKYHTTRLPVPGTVRSTWQQYKASLTDDTAIVSVMWANNETGVLFPVEEMASIARSAVSFSIPMRCRRRQDPDQPERIGHRFPFSLSGHKLHAPKGVGVLYVRKGIPFMPFMNGGHQEHGRRGGTENVASIIGLGKACALAAAKMTEENTRVKMLRDKLEQGLLRTIPKSLLNGHPEQRLPNTSNISFEYVEGEAILLHMNQHNICASSGSACTSGSLEPSHVLRAMGVPFTAAHGSIRFSLSVYNTEEEIDFVLAKMPSIIEPACPLPFWEEN
jgi:cysteine desulfurase